MGRLPLVICFPATGSADTRRRTSEHESLHTTFDYQRPTDTWRLTIDDVAGGKTTRFGDMTLTRNRQ